MEKYVDSFKIILISKYLILKKIEAKKGKIF